MRRILLYLGLIITVALPAASRAQAPREVTIKFMGTQQSALTAEFEAPASVVEAALKERLEGAGLGRGKSDKGFRSYQGITWKEIAPDQVDVYTRVDGKGDKATVVILVSKGYNNFVSSATDPDKVARLQAFLTAFAKDVRAYQVRQAIAVQEEAVKKAEKDYRKAVDDGDKLVKEREKIEKEIVDNRTDQATRQTQLNLERDKLEQLKRQL